MKSKLLPLALVAAFASAGCRKKSEPVVHTSAPTEAPGGDGTSDPGPAEPAEPSDGTDEARDPREVAMETAYQSLVTGDDGAPAKVVALGADALAILERALESQNVVAVLGAIQTLPLLATERGGALLEAALANTAASVRAAALDASAAGPHRVPVAKLVEALADAEIEVRATACDALGTGGVKEAAAVAAVFARLADEDPVVRTACAAAFAVMATPSEWLPKLATQLESPKAEGREGAVRALGELKLAEGFDFIRGRLADPDASVVATALAAIGRYADEPSVREVEPFLKDERRSVRIEAAAALARLPAASVKNLVYEVLKDRDAAVRIEAAAALGRFGDDPETFIRLHALLRDEEAAVRDITALVLEELLVAGNRPGGTSPTGSFSAISGRLADEPDDGVRARLVVALSAADAQRAVPVFIDRLAAAKGQEGTALLVALRTTTGQSLPMDAVQWRAWYDKAHPTP